MIDVNTSGYFKNADKEVIRFIANILYDSKDSDTIYYFFTSGYCYYFALMLKDAYKRGTICWHRNHGHIVWVDDNNVAYDIDGAFYDYDDGDLLPVETSLGELIEDFKHTNRTSYNIPKRFKDWCEHHKMTEIYAIEDIYKNMPEYDDTITVSENVFLYWMTHEPELSEYYNNLNKK